MSSPEWLTDLAARILALLAPAAPYLKQAVEGAVTAIASDVLQKARDLYARLRDRFRADGDEKAEKTLELFAEDPETFESALSKYLFVSLEKHPEWAEEIRVLLAEPSVQEIIARNQSVLERVTQSLSGSGTQRIKAVKSRLKDVKQVKK